jgi:hypothetical protein
MSNMIETTVKPVTRALFALGASLSICIGGVGAAASHADPEPDCALLCGKQPSNDDITFIGGCRNPMIMGPHNSEEQCQPYKDAMQKYCKKMHAHMELCNWAES